MDGIGGEVSNKIRSAIRAKLMELGAYVDDELPDYIMVMVANKRSRQQMEDDLQLFLGDSTVAFTGWLHLVLSKLQQVTIEGKKPIDSEKRKRLPSDEYKKDKRKKSKKDKDKDRGKDKEEEKISENLTEASGSKVPKTIENRVESSESTSEVQEQPKEQTPLTSVVKIEPRRKSTGEDDDDDFLNLKADAEGDLWGDVDTDDVPQNDAKSSKTDGALEKQTTSTPTLESSLPKFQIASTDPVAAKIPQVEKSSKSTSQNSDGKSQPRIINIAQAARQEQETLNSSTRRATDPQVGERKRAHTPIRFISEESETSSEPEDFGKFVADELRKLSPVQRDSAKMKINRRLIKQTLMSHVVSQANSRQAERRIESSSSTSQRPGTQTERRGRRENLGRQDLRLTLRRERERERDRERERERDRERERNRDRSKQRERRSDEVRRLPKGLASVVRGKPKPPVQEDEEQPETSVSSVLQVRPRPKVPAKIQANRSLILKAVADAQKSVTLSLRADSNKAEGRQPLRQAQQHAKIEKSPQSAKKRKRVRPSPAEEFKNMSITVSDFVAEPPKKNIKTKNLDASDRIKKPRETIVIQVPQKTAQPQRILPVKTLTQAHKDKVCRWIKEVEEATKSNQELLGVSDCALSDTADMANDLDDTLNTDCDLEGNDQILTAEGSSVDVDGGLNLSPDADDDDYDDQDYLCNARDVMMICRNGHSRLQWSKSSDPQFVVTLDGLDPGVLSSFALDNFNNEENFENYTPPENESLVQEDDLKISIEPELRSVGEGSDQEEQEQELRNQLLKQQALAKEKQSKIRLPVSAPAPTPPAPTTVPLKNSEDISPKAASAPLPVTPSLERCKFWPSCRHGEKCEYHHPSSPCKLFPNCKFGDRCNYVHPVCRYDGGCTRADCPYTHTLPRPTMTATTTSSSVPLQPIQQACKFFPNCSNLACPYIHPKVCRFGTYCTRLNCQFIHNNKISPSKHRWVRL